MSADSPIGITTLNKPRHIPRHTLNDSPTPGLFVKHIDRGSEESMKYYPHRDDYYMMAILTNGSASLSIDFKEIHLAAGEAVILSPAQIHYSPSLPTDNTEGWLLAIATEHFTEQEKALIAKYALNTTPIHLDKQTAEDITRLFEMTARYSCRYSAAIQLALAIKNLLLLSVHSNSSGKNDRYTALALQLTDLLSRNIHKHKSPSAYAEIMNISEVYLNEAIKSVTGLNVSSFIRAQVMIKARRELTYTSRPAQEIALDLGYVDYTYFSKLFKKETGLTPIQYRKTLKRTSIS